MGEREVPLHTEPADIDCSCWAGREKYTGQSYESTDEECDCREEAKDILNADQRGVHTFFANRLLSGRPLGWGWTTS